MSYDAYLRSFDGKCSHCGQRPPEPEGFHPTYNLTPIFHLALTGEEMPNQDVPEVAVVLFGKKTDATRGLRVLNGKSGARTVDTLDLAIKRMEDPTMAERFAKLAPENGWGTVDGARETLEKMWRAALEYPEYIWRVH